MMRTELKYFNGKHESMIDNLSINILYTSNWLLDNYNIILKNNNLSYNQYYILKILNNTFPKKIAMHLLHHRLFDRNINLSRLIDSLYKMKMVSRTQSTIDRRVVDVEITDFGKILLNEVESLTAKFEVCKSENDIIEAKKLNEMLNSFRKSKN